MKPKLIALAVFLVILAGCGSKQAFNYSQDIVKIEKSLDPHTRIVNLRITGFVSKQQYDSVSIVSDEMVKMVDEKLEELKNLETPDVKEGDNFRNAAIKYFSYIRDTYKAYKRFGDQTTDEGRETERQKLIARSGDVASAVKEMQDAQRKFAEANNFKIENK
jgi:hypothetical protein